MSQYDPEAPEYIYFNSTLFHSLSTELTPGISCTEKLLAFSY